MKFLSITLCNFKSFRGEHTIDLSANENNKEKIILIVGANGSGKTTILEAIKLCMFGKRFNGNVLSDKDYKKYLISVKNKHSVREKDEMFFIQLHIELDDSFLPYSLVLRREWKFNNRKLTKEDFTISREGAPLEIIPREYWEDYLVSLFPPYILEYFFFDGERVKELAIGNNSDKILREAIRDLIGLRSYETLNFDINSLIRKIKYRNINIPGLKKKIEEKDNEIFLADKKISKIDTEIEAKVHKLIELVKEKEKSERNLRRKAGVLAKEKEKSERSLSELNEELEKLNSQIRQTYGEIIPFVIASDLCRDLLNQIKKEKHLKELMASRQVLKELNQKLIEKTKSSKTFLALSPEQLKNIKEEINSIFLGIFEEINIDSSTSLIHDLTGAEMDGIENILNNVRERAKSNIQTILKQRERIIIQSKKLKGKLKQTSNEDFVKEYIDILSTIETNIKILRNEIESLRNDKKILLEKKEKVNTVIGKLEEEIVCGDMEYRKIDVCIRVRNVINEFIETAIISEIEELEQKITHLYNTLSNKDDMVKEIEIDPKELTIRLIGFEDEILNRENISTGEKEIYALSVLWGLSKVSNKKFPIIVDSLLARLDNTHVENIVKNFFPNAGEQVVILAHDREIDERLYNKLKLYIGKEYTLSLYDDKKIKEGYFRR